MEIQRSNEFARWMSKLRDPVAVAKISASIDRMLLRNFGDSRPIGEGLSECRVNYGPGYRIYYRVRDPVIQILWAGDKSTQSSDITRSKTMARTLDSQA
jgi:putative addiction module killer protein